MDIKDLLIFSIFSSGRGAGSLFRSVRLRFGWREAAKQGSDRLLGGTATASAEPLSISGRAQQVVEKSME